VLWSGSNLGPETYYTEFFRSVPQSPHEDAGIIL